MRNWPIHLLEICKNIEALSHHTTIKAFKAKATSIGIAKAEKLDH
jgi:hypothetical protein